MTEGYEMKIITRAEMCEILTEDCDRPTFGYFYPKSAAGAIGARMIYRNGRLEVLGDRVSYAGIDAEVEKEISAHTGEVALVKALEAFLWNHSVAESSEEIIYAEIGDYRMLASPSGSYGYVYLSYWRHSTEFEAKKVACNCCGKEVAEGLPCPDCGVRTVTAESYNKLVS